MIWDRTNRPVWLRCTIGVLFAIIAAAIRLQFLAILELRGPFLTFYPAVAVAALYGGFGAGLLATAVSIALASYFWIEPVGYFTISNFADLISIVVFLASGALISYLAEATYRAQARAHKAEEQSRLAAEREKAAVDLRQSEGKYRELVQNANNAIIRWKRDGSITFFNEYAQWFFGYSAEEVIGKNINILLPEQKSTGGDLTEPFQDIVNHPERYANTINENILRDGSRVWMAWTNKPIRYENGRVMEVLCVGNDVTERKRAEEALRDSETRLRAITDSARDAILMMDPEGMITYWNPAAERILGYTREEADGQNLHGLLAPQRYHATHHAAFPGFVETGRGEAVGKTLELAARRKNGEEIPVELSLSAVFMNGWHAVGLLRDITERKLTEDALRHSEERFSKCFHASPVGISIIRLNDNQFCDVNDAFLDILGYTREEVINHTPIELKIWADPKDRVQMVETLQRQGRVRDLDAKFRRKSGDIVDVRFSNDFIESGGQQYVLGLTHDITKSKQIEERMQFKNILLSTQQETSIDGILVVDENGYIISYNHQFVEMWKITVDLLKTKADETLLQFVVSQLVDPQSFLQQVQYLYENRNIISRDELILADGRVFDRHSAAMFGPEERYYGRVWYFRDVTENKRAEIALRESEERYRSLIETSSDWIWEVDTNGRYTYASSKVHEILGYAPEEVIGRTAFDLMSEEEAPASGGDLYGDRNGTASILAARERESTPGRPESGSRD